MKIILKKSMDNLGKVGTIVSVKDGYARNYLIPNQYAIAVFGFDILYRIIMVFNWDSIPLCMVPCRP